MCIEINEWMNEWIYILYICSVALCPDLKIFLYVTNLCEEVKGNRRREERGEGGKGESDGDKKQNGNRKKLQRTIS